MKRRFSVKDAPVAARRQLQYIRQKEDETVEQFSQRVHFLTLDAYEDAGDKYIHQMAIEAFLRGCREKEAARAAMEKEPTTIHKALKFVKNSIANQRAIFGSRPVYSHRHVTFPDQECLGREDSFEVRTSSRAQCESSTAKLSEDDLSSIVSQLAKALTDGPDGKRPFRSRSPRSPVRSPTRSLESVICFGCKQKGHFERECPEKNVSLKEGQQQQSSPARSQVNC